MTRYLRKCRIAGLAGLASLVVVAFAAAPAGASKTKTVCQGVTPYQKCQTLTVGVSPKLHRKVKVHVTVSDTPSVQVKLFHWNGTKYKFVRTVFVGNVASGTKKLTIRTKTAGKYELKTKADWKGLVAKVTNKFRSRH